MDLEPGSNLLHYRLVEQIGQGGMGVVWKAVDSTLGREVAIKVLPQAFADDPERLARCRRIRACLPMAAASWSVP